MKPHRNGSPLGASLAGRSAPHGRPARMGSGTRRSWGPLQCEPKTCTRMGWLNIPPVTGRLACRRPSRPLLKAYAGLPAQSQTWFWSSATAGGGPAQVLRASTLVRAGEGALRGATGHGTPSRPYRSWTESSAPGPRATRPPPAALVGAGRDEWARRVGWRLLRTLRMAATRSSANAAYAAPLPPLRVSDVSHRGVVASCTLPSSK